MSSVGVTNQWQQHPRLSASYYGINLHLVPDKAKPTEETSFRIKKILKKGMHNGVPSVFVQWENYGELNCGLGRSLKPQLSINLPAHSFDSWIPQTNLTKAAVTD